MGVAGWLQLHARSSPYPLFSANSTLYVMYVRWSGNSGRNLVAWWRWHGGGGIHVCRLYSSRLTPSSSLSHPLCRRSLANQPTWAW